MSRILMVLSLLLASSLAFGGDVPTLQCDVGPLNKVYGKSQWLVYSCNDNLSLVFVAAPGSAATPYVFSWLVGARGTHLHGEGSGDRAATDAAFREIRALSYRDIEDLVAQTKQ